MNTKEIESFLEERLELWRKDNKRWVSHSGYPKNPVICGEATISAQVSRELIWILHRLFGEKTNTAYTGCNCDECVRFNMVNYNTSI